MKYPHVTQDRLSDIVIKKRLTSPQLQELTRKYDESPQADLEGLVDEVLGLPKTITISVTELTEEQKQKITEEKKQMFYCLTVCKKPCCGWNQCEKVKKHSQASVTMLEA